MTTRMLIDARHREETRVAVVKGNQIEELDFESSDHQQLKGNIYLAKVTRVEPSLQAAFVDFGGNRHGFLAFSEIHPDYYQIPKEDRDKLLAEEQEAAAEEAEAREAEEDAGDMSSAPSDDALEEDDSDENAAELVEVDTDTSIDTIDQAEGEMPDDDDKSGGSDNDESADNADSDGRSRRGRSRRGRNAKSGGSGRSASKRSDNARAKRIALRRRYKIQDVIHRRQVMLVQVVKEERGNKGAALTTYLSLAGRYCVLMPNTSHGGGISRKISSASDRKRLKTIVAEMKLPATMGCIIRTAGLQRTKTEIKRDFDYLARLWDDIREHTLRAAAPQLIHTDSDLVKRAIRDIYNRDIEEVMVEGEDGYRAAKDFMKLLMPSHARRVKQYADPVPLFQRYGVEDQLSAMYHPIVQLKSGGYIVINPTEALVSIDINSGRSTKEHGIEQTALSTNLEAAREIARQLRLRDMAGLVVIDFIDMENHSNSRKVERAMKDALKHDRARIQVGKISSFGLMEMSRQRLRTGVLEASTRECPHCEGTGLVRTASSSALSALRLLEEEAAKGKGSRVTLSASQEAAVYVLNSKRSELAEIEQRYGVTVEILPNGDSQGAKMEVSSAGPKPEKKVAFAVIQDSEDDAPEDSESSDDRSDNDDRSSNDDGEGGGRRKGRRRGRRGGRGKRKSGNRSQNDQASNDEDNGSDEQQGDAVEAQASAETPESAEPETDAAPKGKRRPSRRARKSVDEADQIDAKVEDNETPAEDKSNAADAATGEEGEAKPKRRRSRAKKAVEDKAVGEKAADEKASDATADSDASAASADDAATDSGADDKAAPEKPKRRPRARKAAAKSDGTKAKAASKSAGSKNVDDSAGDSPSAAEEQPAAKPSKSADSSGEHYAMASSADKQADAPSDGTTTTGAGTDDGNQSDDGDGSARKGWWQRTFGN